MSRRHRTSRPVMTARVGLTTWMVVFLGCLFAGIVPGIGLLFLVLAAVALMMMVIGVLVRIGGWLLYGQDPEYRAWIENGADPYFDALPPPFNNDSWAVRAGGQPEPATDFIPPDHWMYQCGSCGARNPDNAPVCWHCGSGLQPPREFRCGGCGGTFYEVTFGDLETRGVQCPWCGTVARV